MLHSSTMIILLIIIFDSITAISCNFEPAFHENDKKTIAFPRERTNTKISKGLYEYGGYNMPDSKLNEHKNNEKQIRGRRRDFERSKRRLRCASDDFQSSRHPYLYETRLKRHLNLHNYPNKNLYSVNKGNREIREKIKRALMCDNERTRRELESNFTLTSKEDLQSNNQIIIDSELAKAILRRLSILSSPNAPAEDVIITSANITLQTQPKMEVKENNISVGENENNASMGVTENPIAGENENNVSMGVTENPIAGENENNVSMGVTENPIAGENENNVSMGVTENNDSVEVEENNDNTNMTTPPTCGSKDLGDMTLQSENTHKITDEDSAVGLPCSISGLWVSDAGGIQLDIKASKTRGHLDVKVHELTPAKKGFLSPLWKVTGGIPFLGLEEHLNNTDELQSDGLLGGPFTLTATISGDPSDYGEKKLAVFLGECHVCYGGVETVVGTWNIQRPSKSCRDSLLSQQEVRDVFRKDTLYESLKSKSRRMIDRSKRNGNQNKMNRRAFRRLNYIKKG